MQLADPLLMIRQYDDHILARLIIRLLTMVSKHRRADLAFAVIPLTR